MKKPYLAASAFILCLCLCSARFSFAQSTPDFMTDTTKKTSFRPILLQMMAQNRMTNMGLAQVNSENASWKLNDSTASIGFIYRHIAETVNMFGLFFGLPSEVSNTTMGQQDTGQGANVAQSTKLIEEGVKKLEKLVEESTDEFWMGEIETPFFGKVTRFRLFCHIMYHNSHHAGQISLTLSRGKG